MRETEEQKIRRWLRGRYYSAIDAGRALAWLIDRSSGDANGGVDYEKMAQALLEGGGQGSGDFREILIERKHQIRQAVEAADLREINKRVWALSRVFGLKKEKIARENALPRGSIEGRLERADRAIERSMAKRGLL